jgi:hypothetical protein
MDFFNEGLESLAESTLFYERYTTVPLQDRTWYDLRGFTPETVVRVKSIYNTDANLWLEPFNPLKLNNRWEHSTGSPQLFWTRGIYWFGTWPHYDAEPDNDAQDRLYLRVYFAGIPSRFTNTQAVLRDVPNDYWPAIYDYVLYEMSGIDGKTQASMNYYAKYMKREKSLSRFVDGRVDGARSGRIGGGGS